MEDEKTVQHVVARIVEVEAYLGGEDKGECIDIAAVKGLAKNITLRTAPDRSTCPRAPAALHDHNIETLYHFAFLSSCNYHMMRINSQNTAKQFGSITCTGSEGRPR